MKRAIAATLLLLVVSSLSIKLADASGQGSSSTKRDLPLGDWSVACRPALEPGFVVDAYYVTTDGSKGNTVTKVGLWNRSEKAVTAVKLGWRLFREDAPYTTLLNGETPLLGVTLSANERREVEFPVVSFAKASKGLLKNGEVNGNFIIEVTVTNYLFEDQSGEKISRGGKVPGASFLNSVTGSRLGKLIVNVKSEPTTKTFA